MPRTKAPLWESTEIAKRLLLRTDDLIAFNKPYDWPTTGHDMDDTDCVQYHLITYLREMGHTSPTVKYPRGMAWAIHQLDADTSGIVLFTTLKKRVHHYHTLLGQPETRKHYLAIVSGSPDWDHHIEETALGKLPDGNRTVLGVSDGGQKACTEFTVLDRYPDYSLLKVRLHTGRTHQIRLHLQHLGHPLLGEEWYAPDPCTRHFRQALHAHTLSLPGIPTCPLPEDLAYFL